ncbi:MAG TPA: hydroxyisourate hydrolase [Povalibacter sp.]
MSKLTTHVLDTHSGLPAAGLRIELHELVQSATRLVSAQTTGSDGRCPTPLMEGSAFRTGRYMLTFHVADYFRGRGVPLADPPFIENAVIHFGVAADQNYHVPLLVTPWSYSVYRGS